ncbi:MAG: hypothetical protein PHF63_00680 [Herbinix sp.]|nr:hypothetical protein [Herbinix sp.]
MDRIPSDNIGFKPGQIWWYEDTTIRDKTQYDGDKTIVGKRPVIIIAKIVTPLVVPCSTEGGYLDTHVKLDFGDMISFAECELFSPTNMRYFLNYKGLVKEDKFNEILNVLDDIIHNKYPTVNQPIHQLREQFKRNKEQKV